jgi:hypothetical protein
MGCDPFTCLGFCNKAMSRICIDGLISRFAAAHFGQCNACSPLNALMRAIQRFLARRGPPPPHKVNSRRPSAAPVTANCAEPPGLRRGLNPEAIHTVVWVDDTVFVTKTPQQSSCAGLSSGCPVCALASRSSKRLQLHCHRLAAALGLGLRDDKRQYPSQRVVYTGIVVNTFCGTVSIPPERKLRLASFIESFFDLRECSLTLLASLRGRVQRYSVCFPYILPFTALFSSIISTHHRYERRRRLRPLRCPPSDCREDRPFYL